ncbi:MAG: hypothetical protein ACKN85_05810 [Pirellula sp.]
MEQPLEYRTVFQRVLSLAVISVHERLKKYRTVFQGVLSLAVISVHERLEKTGQYSKEFFH